MNFLIKKISLINRIGVFTEKEINPGKEFYLVPLVETSNIPKSKWAKIGESLWVNDSLILNLVNHSCDPNTRLVVGNRPALISLVYIREGEEITVDYNITETGGVRVPCTCGSENCRGFFMRVE